ncbi:hypothetical protein METH_07665 [Leisingera methylohalidivorans DSM 14336]|uniref:Uncharacterized protein n=1 Tax=Leisingera methylohalidivorans DSM 14336 TaxID=999552 RepID=V9W1D3_9RHOB|nr:hypothetical protein METH_07665 [Leisingera methylohalidivorans DSM 14336]
MQAFRALQTVHGTQYRLAEGKGTSIAAGIRIAFADQGYEHASLP